MLYAFGFERVGIVVGVSHSELRFSSVACTFVDPGDAASTGPRWSADVAIGRRRAGPESDRGARCGAAHRVAKDAEVLALQHENAVLRRQVARVRYQSADRIWRAALSRLIPRGRLRQVVAVTPTTLLRWHHQLVAQKWVFGQTCGPGRPATAAIVKQLILRLARESGTWGRRIQGERARLGYPIAPSTAWEILHAVGIAPPQV
jgi:hypothetical protein